MDHAVADLVTASGSVSLRALRLRLQARVGVDLTPHKVVLRQMAEKAARRLDSSSWHDRPLRNTCCDVSKWPERWFT